MLEEIIVRRKRRRYALHAFSHCHDQHCVPSRAKDDNPHSHCEQTEVKVLRQYTPPIITVEDFMRMVVEKKDRTYKNTLAPRRPTKRKQRIGLPEPESLLDNRMQLPSKKGLRVTLLRSPSKTSTRRSGINWNERSKFQHPSRPLPQLTYNPGIASGVDKVPRVVDAPLSRLPLALEELDHGPECQKTASSAKAKCSNPFQPSAFRRPKDGNSDAKQPLTRFGQVALTTIEHAARDRRITAIHPKKHANISSRPLVFVSLHEAEIGYRSLLHGAAERHTHNMISMNTSCKKALETCRSICPGFPVGNNSTTGRPPSSSKSLKAENQITSEDETNAVSSTLPFQPIGTGHKVLRPLPLLFDSFLSHLKSVNGGSIVPSSGVSAG